MSRPRWSGHCSSWQMRIDDCYTASAAGDLGRPRGRPCDWPVEADQGTRTAHSQCIAPHGRSLFRSNLILFGLPERRAWHRWRCAGLPRRKMLSSGSKTCIHGRSERRSERFPAGMDVHRFKPAGSRLELDFHRTMSGPSKDRYLRKHDQKNPVPEPPRRR